MRPSGTSVTTAATAVETDSSIGPRRSQERVAEHDAERDHDPDEDEQEAVHRLLER